MGYSTEFYGFLTPNKPLTYEQEEEINNFSEQRHDPPQKGQPGIWCQWIINEDGELEWDGAEKFYNYIEWLQYLIKEYFNPWGVRLNGTISWQGERDEDTGTIVVENNSITIEG